jgi:hypothetical protein
MALVPQVFSVIDGIPRQLVAALCVVVFAFFFVTVAARGVGSHLVGMIEVSVQLSRAGVTARRQYTRVRGTR